MRVTSEAQALDALLDEQVRAGGVMTQPASGDTIETDAGWAFFNANGYLGTVMGSGEVVFESEFSEAE